MVFSPSLLVVGPALSMDLRTYVSYGNVTKSMARTAPELTDSSCVTDCPHHQCEGPVEGAE